jgi:hypothetical protein
MSYSYNGGLIVFDHWNNTIKSSNPTYYMNVWLHFFHLYCPMYRPCQWADPMIPCPAVQEAYQISKKESQFQ